LVKKSGHGKDGWLQMSFQLAHYKLNGCSASTYESAANAHYKHGRTETIRSATNKSHAFCQAFVSKSFSLEEKGVLMASAIANHGKLTKEAMTGQGWDRHLFALKWIAEQQHGNGGGMMGGVELPALYTDTAYTTLSNVVLSTSTLTSPALDGGGFGPVGPDCFGIGYGTRDDLGTARFSISSFGLANNQFIECLEESLVEMNDLLE
jgi:carnitine O-palmitoyltransferase 2